MMTIDEAIRAELTEAVQDVLLLGNAESFFSIEEVLSIVFKFYGAVTQAVQFCVITPEQAHELHCWLVAMFEL
jgi:hypothetical protein